MSVAEARQDYMNRAGLSWQFTEALKWAPRFYLAMDAASLSYDLAVAQAHTTTGLRARQEAVWAKERALREGIAW